MQRLFSRSMKVLLPSGYFPPISYFAALAQYEPVIETKEHFIKQSLRNRCSIIGANGPLNLYVPRTKSSAKEPMDECLIHHEENWKTLHWRSLEAAYRNSPYYIYYEHELKSFFDEDYTHLFQLGVKSVELSCKLLGIDRSLEKTKEYAVDFAGMDLRNAWNKKEYVVNPPVKHCPPYIQVFSDRHVFSPDLSILDLLFCIGPSSKQYLQKLELREF